MPDAFFQSDKKRKRPSRPDSGSGSGFGPGRGRGRGGGRSGGRDIDPSSSSSAKTPFHRPAPYGKGAKPPKRGAGARSRKDEDLSSDAGDEGGVDDMDLQAGRGEEDLMSDEEALDVAESAAEKRVRLARGYLDKVREEMEAEQAEGDYDAAEIDREIIASRLQKDVSEAEGRIHTFLGPTLDLPLARSRHLSISSHAPTSSSLTPTHLYVATKRGTVFRYSLRTMRTDGKPFGGAGPGGRNRASGKGKGTGKGKGKGSVAVGEQEPVIGHKGEILCVAASEDGRYVVTGGQDKLVGVWSADGQGEGVQWVAGLKGHKDAVTSIAFPPLSNPSHHILTASLSRHLALQSLSTLSTIDTFFGHQDALPSVHALKPTTAVTAGSRDRTCRWWKVEEEVQLVLRGGGRGVWRGQGDGDSDKKADDQKQNQNKGDEAKAVNGNIGQVKANGSSKGAGIEFVEGSIDVVCMLDDQRFVSGGDSGSICLWTTAKKKPIYTVPFAHGVDAVSPTGSEIPGVAGSGTGTGTGSPSPRWITALGALRGTDLFASGSWDGQIRLWALDPSFRSFKPVGSIPAAGFVNGLNILSVPAANIDEGILAPVANANANANADADGAAPLGLATDVSDAKSDAVPERASAETETKTKPKGKGTKDGRGQNRIVLAAALSQEPRLGRWMRLKNKDEEQRVRNGAVVVVLPTRDV